MNEGQRTFIGEPLCISNKKDQICFISDVELDMLILVLLQ